jgi:hypothetical protein
VNDLLLLAGVVLAALVALVRVDWTRVLSRAPGKRLQA